MVRRLLAQFASNEDAGSRSFSPKILNIFVSTQSTLMKLNRGNVDLIVVYTAFMFSSSSSSVI